MTRKAIAAALVVAAVLFGLQVPAHAEDGLVLHYDFDSDLSSGVVADRSGSGLDGKLVNPGSATSTTGADGSPALRLRGGASSDSTAPYVSIPNGLFAGRTAVTISTWANWSGGEDFQWVYCVGKDLNTATFITPSYSGVGRTRSSIKPVNGNSEVGVTATQKLPADRWVNLVTTIDGQTISYYVNGAKVGATEARLDLGATMHAAANTTSGYLGKPWSRASR